MQLCYEEGRRLGFLSFAIHGGTGGRPDHTFANYSLLLRIAEDGGRATLYSEKYLATVIKNTSITLRGKCGNHLSVFAFGGNAEGVSVLGAEYEARDVTLTPDFPLGVSNSFKDGDAVISVSSGALLVMWEK